MSQGTVLITGASGEIGRATAEAFASRGYNLTLLGFKKEKEVTRLAIDLSVKYEILCNSLCGDLGEPEFVKDVFERFGSPEIVVNNAGTAFYGLLTETSPEILRRILQTNLEGIYNVCRQAVPGMLAAGGGRIVNVSSVWGIRGAANETAYSTSKGAVNALTRALAKELAASHIAVNAAALGAVDTAMTTGHLNQEERSRLNADIPYGRMAAPKEAATFIVQLCQMPLYLTGQVIAFDGGWQT